MQVKDENTIEAYLFITLLVTITHSLTLAALPYTQLTFMTIILILTITLLVVGYSSYYMSYR